MEERERRRRRRRANSDVEETPTPIDSADPGVVPGFCDSASRSPFLSLSLSLFLSISLSLSLSLSTLCCRHFPFASWPRKFHGGSSLHLQLLVPLRPRGCAQEEEEEEEGMKIGEGRTFGDRLKRPDWFTGLRADHEQKRRGQVFINQRISRGLLGRMKYAGGGVTIVNSGSFVETELSANREISYIRFLSNWRRERERERE